MTHQPDHKTLPGGSIDYAHYIRRGRTVRSLAVHDALGRLRGLITANFKSVFSRRQSDRETPKPHDEPTITVAAE